jgi:hypothetical protein
MCLEKLLRIVTPVNEGEERFIAWSEQSSFLDLLAEQRTGRSIILYSSCFNHGRRVAPVPVRSPVRAEGAPGPSLLGTGDGSATGNFLFQLPNPLLQELPLRFLLGQRQSFLIRGPSLSGPAEPAANICTR